MLDIYTKADPTITLRQIAGSYLSGSDSGLMIGTPEQVADHMVYLLEEGGGDGFQITPSYYAPDFFAGINEMLIPLLQKRGVFREEYNGQTLRDYMNEGETESRGAIGHFLIRLKRLLPHDVGLNA